jgi:hypothetical protein
MISIQPEEMAATATNLAKGENIRADNSAPGKQTFCNGQTKALRT